MVTAQAAIRTRENEATRDAGRRMRDAEAYAFRAQQLATAYRTEKLEAANIIASLRADRSGRQHLRLSPHFYNTDAELQRVVQLL